MKKEFMINGPLGELHGVIHKCPDEFEAGNVMIMCTRIPRVHGRRRARGAAGGGNK